MTLQQLDHDRNVTSGDGAPAPSSAHPILRRKIATGVAVLMLIESASLAVVSALHLSGMVDGRTSSFDPDSAGIAEAVIGAVLLVGALVMLRDPQRARMAGLVANGFALAGFLIGISETTQSGHAPDIAYHASVIPLLVISLVILLRRRSTEPAPPAT